MQFGHNIKVVCWTIKDKVKPLLPGRRAWRGAAFAVSLGTCISWVFLAIAAFAPAGAISFLIALPAGLIGAFFVGGLLTLIIIVLRKLPPLYFWSVSGSIFLLTLIYLAVPLVYGTLFIIVLLIISSSLIGGSLAALLGNGNSLAKEQSFTARLSLVLGLLLLGGGFALFSGMVVKAEAPLNAAALSTKAVEILDLPDPSLPGLYPVQMLTYGSGIDRKRQAYGEQVSIKTSAVDGSLLIKGWSGLRSRYWGFGPDQLPLNGMVWYPEGEGPFPLILIVHGNHLMEQDSEGGYAYLGELLAGRGAIVVSVDQNFLNFSMAANLTFINSLQDENDVRAWLLLEHLQLWYDWNRAAESIFYRQVDFDSIGLIGHSRGGEAVAIAAAFSQISRHPDHTELLFDYPFTICAVAAIAPVDGQYMPGDRRLPLQNVNYLVLHGSHDMDVISFQGSRQYSRLNFSDDGHYFKSAVYIYGANHGQFNSDWGREDLFGPALNLFNLNAIMPLADQQQVAAVFISAFIEAALKDQDGYKNLFRDPRTAGSWLPDKVYLARYSDTETMMLCDFSEDLDPGTTTVPGGIIKGENMFYWREGDVPLRWGTLETSSLYLGWNKNQLEGKIPQYHLVLPRLYPEPEPSSCLVFDLAVQKSNLKQESQAAHLEFSAEKLIDFTIVLIDRQGNRAVLPLSHFAFPQPPLESRLGKVNFMQSIDPVETVFQSYHFSLTDFQQQNPLFSPAELKEVIFKFDKTESGSIIVDNIGLRRAY